MPFAGGDVRRAFPSGKRGLEDSVTFFPGQGLDTADLVRRAGWSCKGYVRRSAPVAGGGERADAAVMGPSSCPGREEADSGCKRADKAKDSPEAALYVKAGQTAFFRVPVFFLFGHTGWHLAIRSFLT